MKHRIGDLATGLMCVVLVVVMALTIDAPPAAAGPREMAYRSADANGVSSGSGSLAFFGSMAAVLVIGGIVVWTSRRARKQ